MLKTTGLLESSTKAFMADDNGVVDGADEINGTVVNLFKNKKSKKLTCIINIRATGKANFPTFDVRKGFNHLRLAFIKAPILQYFDLKSHIQIKTDASSYAIGGMLSQLNLDSNAPPNDFNLKSDFVQWHLVACFFRKMISTKTQYKTHDIELLGIVKAFKT